MAFAVLELDRESVCIYMNAYYIIQIHYRRESYDGRMGGMAKEMHAERMSEFMVEKDAWQYQQLWSFTGRLLLLLLLLLT